ncbi:MAG: histidine kinase N-terminal 7TM domain-containing protein [Eubacteriales bacterium]|nr:histidine kinase N-terminal 7TM domain-containing protein [Eubacteriales bacterium]
MTDIAVSFTMLHISLLLVAAIMAFILKMRNKSQIHYVFLSYLFFMILWDIGLLMETYADLFEWKTYNFYLSVTHIGLIFTPLAMLLFGLIFARSKIVFTKRYLLLLIIPALSAVIYMTNDLHGLFYIKYSLNNSETMPGYYFLVHAVYSYGCFITGLFFLIRTSIKNSGLISRQSLLIIIGTMIPLIVNVMATFNLAELNAYATPVAFSIAVVMYAYAIMKFNFLNIVPIALKNVVDLISDSFVVLNEEMRIVDFNRTFADMFEYFYRIKRNDYFPDLLDVKLKMGINGDELSEFITKARKSRKAETFERHIREGSFDKYFMIEVTSIYSRRNYLGAIILLKDITQSVKDLQTIKEKQSILMEHERLVSLGQLVGGIAHNLKTPIMSVSGGIEALKDLVAEYDESIDDELVTGDDHHEIASEMAGWLEKMKPHCSYMSDIITTVKGQTVQYNTPFLFSFTLDELIKRVELLMKHELNKYHCRLNVSSEIDMGTKLDGDISNMIQVFDNLIINAIQAYKGSSGDIDLNIKKDDNSNIVFTIQDYGEGIKEDIKPKLFKEMITTKGKEGTGLGLYISYANVKGRFGGNMWFESKEGEGTTFYISIPETI